MTIKEQIAKILQKLDGESSGTDELKFFLEDADQILDLILSKIVIEKKTCNFRSIRMEERVEGWNDCLNQLEEIKSKLRD